MLLEGPNVFEAALDAGVTISEVFTLDASSPSERRAADTGIPVSTVSDTVLARLAGTTNPRGPVAVASIPASPELSAADTLVLAGVRDPGNAGALIRTAAALAFQVVAFDSVDVWSPKTLRAGAGAHFRTTLAVADPADPVRWLEQAGIEPVALVVDGGEPIDELPDDPVGLMVGSEAHGLDPDVVAAVRERVTLPMAQRTDSFNATVAGAIAMWERSRRHR